MTIMEKIKETINKLPFNGLVGKIPALAKVASYANYAFCGLILIIFLIIAMPDGGQKHQKLHKQSEELMSVEEVIKNKLDLNPHEFIALFTMLETDENDINEMICEYELKDASDKVNFLLDRMDLFEEVLTFLDDEEEKELEEYIKSARNYIKANKKTINAIIKSAAKKNNKEKDVKTASKKRSKSKKIDNTPNPETDFSWKAIKDFSEIVIDDEFGSFIYEGERDNIVIPAEIQGVPVKRVFMEVPDRVESIVIPEGVEIVSITNKNYTAYSNYSELKSLLTSIKLPSTLKGLTLRGFSNLKVLEIPDGVIWLNIQGVGIKDLKLPNVLFLAFQCFWNCDSLENIEIPENADIYSGQASWENNTTLLWHVKNLPTVKNSIELQKRYKAIEVKYKDNMPEKLKKELAKYYDFEHM